MERALYQLMLRCFELLLAIPVWDTFKAAESIAEGVELFLHQPELVRVGIIAIAAVIVRALYLMATDAWTWLQKVLTKSDASNLDHEQRD